MPNSSRHAVDSIAHDPRCESLDDTRQVLFRRADGILALRSPGESKVQLENRVPRHDDQRWCAHVRWYVVSYPPCQVTPRRVMPRHVTPRDATPHACVRTLCTDSNRTAFLCVRDAGTYQCYSDPNDPNYPAQPIGSCKGCTSPSPGFCSPQNADGFNATKCSTCNLDVVPYVSTTLRCVSYQSVRMDSFSYSP